MLRVKQKRALCKAKEQSSHLFGVVKLLGKCRLMFSSNLKNVGLYFFTSFFLFLFSLFSLLESYYVYAGTHKGVPEISNALSTSPSSFVFFFHGADNLNCPTFQRANSSACSSLMLFCTASVCFNSRISFWFPFIIYLSIISIW